MGQQQGAALVVSLMLLVILTLLAVSTINTTTVNMRIVNNMQDRQQAELAAVMALEYVLSDDTRFTAGTSLTLSVNNVSATVAKPVCLSSQVQAGSSAVQGGGNLTLQDTVWIADVTVDNTDSGGASVQARQGVSLLLPAGNCTIDAPGAW